VHSEFVDLVAFLLEHRRNVDEPHQLVQIRVVSSDRRGASGRRASSAAVLLVHCSESNRVLQFAARADHWDTEFDAVWRRGDNWLWSAEGVVVGVCFSVT
jgi:hypothetical protein